MEWNGMEWNGMEWNGASNGGSYVGRCYNGEIHGIGKDIRPDGSVQFDTMANR